MNLKKLTLITTLTVLIAVFLRSSMANWKKPNTAGVVKNYPSPSIFPSIIYQSNKTTTYKQIEPSIDPDPIITCSSNLCSGGQVRRSACVRSTCCEFLHNKWVFYLDKAQCKRDQDLEYMQWQQVNEIHYPVPNYSPIPYPSLGFDTSKAIKEMQDISNYNPQLPTNKPIDGTIHIDEVPKPSGVPVGYGYSP